MALHESDREDLLAEASAYVDRFAIHRVFAGQEPIELFVGRRKSGAISLYDSFDRVFQFDDQGNWRRGFFNGIKLGIEDGKMIELCRPTQGGRVHIQRVQVDSAVREEYLAAWEVLTVWLRKLPSDVDWQWVGSVPSSETIPDWFFDEALALRIQVG